MRLAAFLTGLALAACSPAPSEHTPSQQQQASLAPAPGAAEVAERQRAQDAALAAAQEARAAVDPNAGETPAPPPPFGPRIVTLELTQLLPSEARAPRNGGSAAVLLASPDSSVGAAKNLALCRALYARFDGQRNARDRANTPRTLYWFIRELSPPLTDAGAEPCLERLAAYDYGRAERIGAKLGLLGAGPYLIAERHDLFEDERVAAVIDLARTPPDQIDAAVRYFRDRMLWADDVWTPPLYVAEDARADMASFLDTTQTDLPFAPRLVRAARDAGCPLTDLRDLCQTPE